MAQEQDTSREPEPQSYIDTFFSVAADALVSEDKFLAQRLAEGEAAGFYSDYPQGISFLFETTLIYLIFRELLARDFPRREHCEVRWEEPYPDSVAKKADLLLKPSPPQPEAFVECKIWKKERGEDLKGDVDKMRGLPSESRRFLLVLWSELSDGIANLEWLENELPGKIVGSRRFPTKCRNRDRKIETRNALLGLLELQG